MTFNRQFYLENLIAPRSSVVSRIAFWKTDDTQQPLFARLSLKLKRHCRGLEGFSEQVCIWSDRTTNPKKDLSENLHVMKLAPLAVRVAGRQATLTARGANFITCRFSLKSFLGSLFGCSRCKPARKNLQALGSASSILATVSQKVVAECRPFSKKRSERPRMTAELSDSRSKIVYWVSSINLCGPVWETGAFRKDRDPCILRIFSAHTH